MQDLMNLEHIRAHNILIGSPTCSNSFCRIKIIFTNLEIILLEIKMLFYFKITSKIILPYFAENYFILP